MQSNKIFSTAKIYAVGVGPGDPELLTRKAERIIRQTPVICTPTGQADAASYALSIVEELLDRSRQEIIVQLFPMTKDEEALRGFWEAAAAEVLAKIDAGLDIAFITIGDPLLYSTFLYLYRIFREHRPDVPIEIVPGISSINAAAAAAGIPLGMAGGRIAILPATYADDELRRTLKDFDTVVLLKVSRVFDRVYAMLCDLGLEENAAFIRRVGSDQEEIVFDLATLVWQTADHRSMPIIRQEEGSRQTPPQQQPSIFFVGAGPGDAELITVKGARLLSEAAVVVFRRQPGGPGAGADLCACCPGLGFGGDESGGDDAECWREPVLAGQRVVRLHTGDPSIYGAIQEQMAGPGRNGHRLPGCAGCHQRLCRRRRARSRS